MSTNALELGIDIESGYDGDRPDILGRGHHSGIEWRHRRNGQTCGYLILENQPLTSTLQWNGWLLKEKVKMLIVDPDNLLIELAAHIRAGGSQNFH